MAEPQTADSAAHDYINAHGFYCYLCDSERSKHVDQMVCGTSDAMRDVPVLIVKQTKSIPCQGHRFSLEAVCPWCESKFLITVSSIHVQTNALEYGSKLKTGA